MKNIATLFAFGIVILTATSCGTTKKTPTKTDHDLTLWTVKLQNEFKFTADQLKEIDFYSSNAIVMSGGFFSHGATIEDGVVIASDTTARYSRTFDKQTKGKIVGTPQKDPGFTVIKSFSILFEKGDIVYTFQFDLASDGSYVLNSHGEITYEGKKYKITTYNPQTNMGEKCKLLFALKRQSVIIDDVK